MIIEITKYDKEKNTCFGITKNGSKIEIDPFVACGIKMSDEQYKNNFGYTVVGKMYNIADNTFVSNQGCFCPDEFQIEEISETRNETTH